MFAFRRRLPPSFLSFENILKTSTVCRLPHNRIKNFTCTVLKSKKNIEDFGWLFSPNTVSVDKKNAVGAEIVGTLEKGKIVKIINEFFKSQKVKFLAEENGVSDYFFKTGLANFRSYCLEAENLPTDLHIVLSDIEKGFGNYLDLLPYFLRHVRQMFPYLECMDDLKNIGDLRSPAKWYPEARNMKRKIYYHCGPTNSGKTYHAIQRFLKAKSGIYCGPLKLLAVEIFNKANEEGVICDLVTGEEIICSRPDGDHSSHVSCTVEMCSLEKNVEVAIIDEIQMIKDIQRGWAWTRALLGVRATEIHLCGEEAAIEIVDSILCTSNEEFEIKKYSRLTSLSVVPPVEDFRAIKPGDCIVCFNKHDVYSVTKALENLGVETAIIYGALPPTTKLAQCKKFNDPNDPCNVLVATDAVGMGLNLSIKRIIFYSIMKAAINELGEKEIVPISVSQALQIAGRAGRYGSKYSEGFVTTFKAKDLPLIKEKLSQTPEPVLAAGITPTVDQIEIFSYYFPNTDLSRIIQIFKVLSRTDDSIYFMCNLDDVISLSRMIDHVPLPIKIKYNFCCAPVNLRNHFTCVMFVKYAKIYSSNNIISFDWVCRNIKWPLKAPNSVRELSHCEDVYDSLDLYLWLSNRFPDYFCDADAIRQLQKKLDVLIEEGVINMSKLIKNILGNQETENFRLKN